LGDTPPQQSFDLIAANILAGPLIEMAPKLAACTSGLLVLSGLLTTQVEAISDAYRATGLKISRTDSMDEWASVEMMR